MTEPRICYYFLRIAGGRTLFLLALIFIILLVWTLKHISSTNIFESAFRVVCAIIGNFVLAVIVLCVLNAVTARINPAGYGICYNVDASYSYIPSISALCDEEGYTKDEYGVPLFSSYDEYREWFIAEHPDMAFPEKNYKYTDEELAQIACDYYNARSTETAVGCYITQGEGVTTTLTLVNSEDVVLAVYEIDRDELEGSDKYGNYVYLKR